MLFPHWRTWMNSVSIWRRWGSSLLGCWQSSQGGGHGAPTPPVLPWGQGWSMPDLLSAIQQKLWLVKLKLLTSPTFSQAVFCRGKLISWLFPLGSVVGYPGSEGIKWAGPSGIRRHPGGIRYGWYSIQELRFFCFIDLTYLWLHMHNGLHYECHVDLRSCQ